MLEASISVRCVSGNTSRDLVVLYCKPKVLLGLTKWEGNRYTEHIYFDNISRIESFKKKA